MPSDFIIRTGDMIQITVPPPAIVPMIVAPVPLVGSEKTVKVGMMDVCVFGDELPKVIAGALPYVHVPPPAPVTPGVGKLTIILKPDNLTTQSVAGMKPMILKGKVFDALFTVTTPATVPSPGGPVPDPLVVKKCTCQFITSNLQTYAG